MGRDFRFRISGIIFFMVFLLNLSVTNNGICFISEILKNPSNLQIGISIISGVFIFFASDSIGYIFGTFFQLVFNVFGGYSGIYQRSFGDLNEYIIQKYSQIDNYMSDNDEKIVKDFKTRLPDINTEQILVFFFWHSKNGATEDLKLWVERRHTAYFTSYGAIVAIFFATLISYLIIAKNDIYNFSYINWIILGFSIIFCIGAVISAETAMKDAVRVVDLQIASFIEPRMKQISKQFEKNEKVKTKKLPQIITKNPL